MDFEKNIRELAKSNKYQTIYSNAREAGMNIFENKTRYTDAQITFLNYLSYYYGIYTDIAMDYVDEIILDDFIYEDSYMYYKRKSKLKEEKKHQKNTEEDSNGISSNKKSWVFKSKPKK